MTTITFDITAFRANYPQFANNPPYTDGFLQNNWDVATCYISDNDFGFLNGACRTLALNLLTAHISMLMTFTNNGDPTGILQSATEDKITVAMVPPPISDGWDYWMQQTPYGSQLIALLSQKAVGGFYFGGAPERGAFRGIYGSSC